MFKASLLLLNFCLCVYIGLQSAGQNRNGIYVDNDWYRLFKITFFDSEGKPTYIKASRGLFNLDKNCEFPLLQGLEIFSVVP